MQFSAIMGSIYTYHQMLSPSLYRFLFIGTLLFVKSSLLAKEITFSEQILGRILDREQRFFANDSVHEKNEKEMTRQAQEIVANYENYIAQNPKDENALILFGKFLRKVGQEEHATEFFLEADKINPKLAVVKQQLANYLIEKNRPVDAFPLLVLTIELDPKEAIYHFHLGNFLFLFQEDLIKEKILTQDAVHSFMHRSFYEAKTLEPNNFEFQLRYAQSFFDFNDSNKTEALLAWQNIENVFPGCTVLEKDYFRLCQARVLLELDFKKDASALLHSVSSKSLRKTRNQLLMQINFRKTPEVPNSKSNRKKQSSVRMDHQLFIPSDPHLIRLRKLTSKLIEEKMLSELKVDAIKAKFDPTGDIKIELTNLQK